MKAFDQVSEDATPFIRISMALCFKSLINLNFLLYIIEFHIHNGVYYNTSFKYLVDIGKRTDYFLHFLEEARTIVKKGGVQVTIVKSLPAFTCIFVRGEEKNAKVFPEDIFPHISKGSHIVSPYLFLALKKEHYQNINLCFHMFCLLFGKMIHILDKNGDLPYTICHA